MAMIYFANHSEAAITPVEWMDFVVWAAFSMNNDEIQAPALAEEMARLQLQLLNDTTAARVDGANSAVRELAESMEALEVSDVEKPGFSRAVEIVKRGVK